MTNQLLPHLIDILTPLLLALIGYATLQATLYLRRKQAELAANAPLAYALGVADRLTDAAGAVVAELAQGMAGEFKARAANGKLSKSDIGELQRVAASTMRDYLGSKALDDMQRVLGADAVEAMLSAKIEEAVVQLKASQPFVVEPSDSFPSTEAPTRK